MYYGKEQREGQGNVQSMIQAYRNTADGKYKAIPKVSECVNLQECELERQKVLKVVSKLVPDIQNPGLGEHRIRELNDEINKVIQELRIWEDRIKSCGVQITED